MARGTTQCNATQQLQEGTFARRAPGVPGIQMNGPIVYPNALPPNITPSSSPDHLIPTVLGAHMWGGMATSPLPSWGLPTERQKKGGKGGQLEEIMGKLCAALPEHTQQSKKMYSMNAIAAMEPCFGSSKPACMHSSQFCTNAVSPFPTTTPREQGCQDSWLYVTCGLPHTISFVPEAGSGPRHRKLAAHSRFLPLRMVWIQEHNPGKRMFACRGGLVEEEEGPRHSRVWEDEGRGGRRGKRWRTREEVEDEGRRGSRAIRNVLQRHCSRRVPRHSDANQGACCPDSGHPANQQG